MYKLVSSCAISTDLLYGFDSNIKSKRNELTNNKAAGQKTVFYNRIG